MSVPEGAAGHEALVKVQAMLHEGASPEKIQSFLAQMVGPRPPTGPGKGTQRSPKEATAWAAGLDAPPSVPSGSTMGSPGIHATTAAATRPGQGFVLPAVIPGSGAGAVGSVPISVANVSASIAATAGQSNNNDSGSPLIDLRPGGSATSPSAGRPSPGTCSTPMSSIVRPEARRDINAFLDSSYTRVPMPRRNMNASLGSGAPAGVPSRVKLEPLVALAPILEVASAGASLTGRQLAATDVTAELPEVPKARRETCVPNLTVLDMSLAAAEGTPNSSSRGESSGTGGAGAAAAGVGGLSRPWPSAGLPNSGVAETPTFRGCKVTGAHGSTNHSAGLAVKRGARGRRCSAAESIDGANDSIQESVAADSEESFLPLGTAVKHTLSSGGNSRTCRSGGTFGAANQRRRNSVLPVTALLARLEREGLNGSDAGNDSNDVFAADWEAETGGNGGLPGPRFARAAKRDTDAHVPLEETKRLLAELGLPFVPELHKATAGVRDSTNQTGDAAPQVDPLVVARRHGPESFISITMNCFLRYSFMDRFGFSPSRLLNFVTEAFSFFRPGNPLHHPIHAADIVIAAHQWLCQPNVVANLSDEEILGFLFSATVMRVGHSGIDNRTLTQMKHPYAMMCSYASPQQGATVALVMALLEKPHCRFFPRIFHTKVVDDSMASSTIAHEHPPADEDNGAVPGEERVTPRKRKHAWTQFREYQFFDTVAELVMATDERNHFVFHGDMVEVRNDHFRSHGCLCPVRAGSHPFSGEEERYATLVCHACCCYICDTHLPKILKAVLHFIDYAYLFRPFEIFLTATTVGTAENYRQQECVMRILSATEKLQRAAMQEESKAARRIANAPRSPTAAARQQVVRADGEAPEGSAVAADAADADADVEDDVEASADRAEAALLAEQPTWRTDALHSSTLSSLRTLQAMPLRMAEKILIPRANRGVAPCPAGPEEESPEEDNMTLSNRSLSVTLPSGGAGAPRIPLQGQGRDILLVSLEELYFPFLEELRPYLPKDWCLYARHNYERLLAEMPTPEEYDAVAQKVLYITAPELPPGANAADFALGPGRLPMQRSVAELRETIPLAKYIPFEDLARLVPAQPRWHYDHDGLESRILGEITQAGQLWTAFGEMSRALWDLDAAAAAANNNPSPSSTAAAASPAAVGRSSLSSPGPKDEDDEDSATGGKQGPRAASPVAAAAPRAPATVATGHHSLTCSRGG